MPAPTAVQAVPTTSPTREIVCKNVEPKLDAEHRIAAHWLNTALTAVSAAVIGAYVWLLVKSSVRVFFSTDDLQNLYRGWNAPIETLLQANLLFFLSNRFHRPLGQLWYRSIYHVAGFHAFPFHAINLGFLSCNIVLTYLVARRLSRSDSIAAITALFVAYHPRMDLLYFNTGFIYDVLSYFFCMSAFLYYLRVRQKDALPSGWDILKISLLYCCAISTKEIGVSLPVILLTYEVMYHRPNWCGIEFRKFIWRQGRTIVVIGLITLAFIIGRSYGDRTVLLNPAFCPVFTLQQFMLTSSRFISEITFVDNVQPMRVAGLWSLMLIAALLAKSRILKFAWLLLMITPLPIAFIAARSAGQYYLPFFFWSLYTADVLVGAVNRAWRHYCPDSGALERFRGLALLVVLALVLFAKFNRQHYDFETEQNKSVARQVHQMHPTLANGSKLLFLHDPLKNNYQLLALLRLCYHDLTLTVDCADRMKRALTPAEIAEYSYVFDSIDGLIIQVRDNHCALLNPDKRAVAHSLPMRAITFR